MTQQPRRIATARDYDQLHRAIRARVDELGVSRETIDRVCGLPDGYASKLLAPVPIKGYGRTSLGPVLQGLGLAIDLVVVDEVPRIVEMGVRNESQVRQLEPGKLAMANMPEIRAIGRKALRVMLSKNGRKGGKRGGRARAKKLTPAARRRIARKAGLASAKARREAHTQNGGALLISQGGAIVSVCRAIDK